MPMIYIWYELELTQQAATVSMMWVTWPKTIETAIQKIYGDLHNCRALMMVVWLSAYMRTYHMDRLRTPTSLKSISAFKKD